MLAAEVFLGNDLLAWLVLALGGALVVGNGLALIRPPDRPGDDGDTADTSDGGDGGGGAGSGDLARAPIARTIVMIVVGLVAAVWAVATLTT